MIHKHKELAQKILLNVERLPWSGCWVWLGPLDTRGYGVIYDKGHIQTRAHRVSYRELAGSLGDKQVLHKCDVRCCVNPQHLYLGTHNDNMRDIWVRNRAPRGSRRPFSKLTEDQVREIKASHLSHEKLAKLYGVGHKAIENIKAGRKWKHVQ